MPAPRVAILIPSYNSADTIAQTLDSVQCQLPGGASGIRVYLVDDASKDDTIAVARQTWKAQVPLQVIVREQNLGQWPNKNSALAEIADHADWVFLLHSDDLARSVWLSVLLDRVSHCPATVATICSGWENLTVENPPSSPDDDAPPKINEIKGTLESVHGTLLKGCWWLISGCAIRLAAFQDVGPFDNRFYCFGDYDWLLRCLHKGWGVELVNKNLIYRRIRVGSVGDLSRRLRHLDIRDNVILYQRYAALLSATEIFRLHREACGALFRRMVRSSLNFNIRRFVSAWSTLFWLLGELFMVTWPRVLRQDQVR
jgi:glycosyltransferase involved in cell wall biosynthesis